MRNPQFYVSGKKAITVVSHKPRHIFNHQPLDYSSCCFFRITTEKTKKFFTVGLATRKAFPFHWVVMTQRVNDNNRSLFFHIVHTKQLYIRQISPSKIIRQSRNWFAQSFRYSSPTTYVRNTFDEIRHVQRDVKDVSWFSVSITLLMIIRIKQCNRVVTILTKAVMRQLSYLMMPFHYTTEFHQSAELGSWNNVLHKIVLDKKIYKQILC